ncbi:MAG: hypothetical protein WAV82_12840, partial [Methylobacter sp.]
MPKQSGYSAVSLFWSRIITKRNYFKKMIFMGGVDLKLARLLFVNTLIVLTTNSVIVGVRLLRTYREHETTKENSGMANKKKNFSPSKVSTNPGKKIRACLHKRS